MSELASIPTTTFSQTPLDTIGGGADDVCVEELILAHVPTNGDTIGNVSCLRKIRRTHPAITHDQYWAAQKRLVHDKVLFTPWGGKGGAACRYEFRDRPRQVHKTVSSKLDIQAVIMDGPDDSHPKFIGRAFLDWESDPLHREASRYYSSISTKYHKTRTGPLLACQDCHHPILVTGMSGQHKRALKHRADAPADCPCVGQSVGDKGVANNEIHGDGPTSDEHEQTIADICKALLTQFPSVDPRSFEISQAYADEDLPNPIYIMSLINKQPVILDGIRLNKALHAEDGETYRRPDISFKIRQPDGRVDRWAIEVQRSHLFTDDIVERTGYYRENGVNLIWIVIDTLAATPTSRTALDFQDVHRGRLVLFDNDAFRATHNNGALHLTFAEFSTVTKDPWKPVGARTLRFPDQMTVLNHVVCDNDHRGDASIARAETSRARLKRALRPLGDRRNNNAHARARAEAAIPPILLSAMEGYTDARDAHQTVTIESKAFRSLMVMATMLERTLSGDMSQNLTTSFKPKGPYILSLERPEATIHIQIVTAFAVCTGYEDLRVQRGGKPFFRADFDATRRQFKALTTLDRRLYEVFLAEAFCAVTRHCLGEVGRLPCWAIVNPLTGELDPGATA